MTQLLEKAIEELRKQPESCQDAIAARIIEEIEDEARWDNLFARSQDMLAEMAQQAREEIIAGKVRVMGIDEL